MPNNDPKTVRRAYSTFEIKSIDEDLRVIEGIASTPSLDRMEDIVEPMGAEFSLPLPLLWQHNSREPIGEVYWAKPNKSGIPIKARFAKVIEPGKLKDRLDEAWQSIKYKLVRGLSIGFVPIESEEIDKTSWGRRHTKWNWLELSAVTIPANQDASIQAIKSADQLMLRAASGTEAQPSRVVRLAKSPPGVPGSTVKDTTMSTMKEQLASWEAKRAAAVARISEIMKKSGDAGSTLDAEEAKEHDALLAEVKTIDEHIKRVRDTEALLVAGATEVTKAAGASGEAASEARGGGVVSVKSNVQKGTAFARYAIALARSRGNIMQALEISKEWRDSTPEVELAIKTAVAAGTARTSGYAAELVAVNNMASEFIDLLRPATIIGRIPNFRRVPFNVKMPRQLTGASAHWVGENRPKPISALSFDTVTLGFAKCAGIVVLTEELVKLSSPSAEAVVRNDLIQCISQFEDQQFIDPTVTAVSNVSPAAVTQGATPVTSTGQTVAAITKDVSNLMAKFIAADISLDSGTWVMHPRTALYLSLLRTAQDLMAFPTISMQGGTWFGLPVVVSRNVPVSSPTGDTTIIALLNANDIFLADEGGVTLDASREASVQMSDSPGTGAAALVSFWQNNLVGLRAERMVNWILRRDEAVQVIDSVQY